MKRWILELDVLEAESLEKAIEAILLNLYLYRNINFDDQCALHKILAKIAEQDKKKSPPSKHNP